MLSPDHEGGLKDPARADLRHARAIHVSTCPNGCWLTWTSACAKSAGRAVVALDAVDLALWHRGRHFLKDLVDYWRHAYDWRRCEEKLNALPATTSSISASSACISSASPARRSRRPPPLPLILTHGWPGSTVEFLDIIDKLAHPERHGGNPIDAFDVIVPSLPGYGLSGPPMRETAAHGPIGPRAIAELWHRLMTEQLNYRPALCRARRRLGRRRHDMAGATIIRERQRRAESGWSASIST